MPRLFSRILPFVILPFLTGQATAAEALGRLFHTPAERAALDQLRLGSTPDQGTETAEQITLDGVVKRSNGTSTTWINGIPQQDNEHAQGVLVLGKPATYGGAVVQLPSGQNVKLKAAQTYDAASGRIQEESGMPSPQVKVIQPRNVRKNSKK
ncbi:MAG: hypothetical protein JSS58_02070 [Proteobacteria bacterium]|nr:hypothetical protein [Pseudomonadota bacterium]